MKRKRKASIFLAAAAGICLLAGCKDPAGMSSREEADRIASYHEEGRVMKLAQQE